MEEFEQLKGQSFVPKQQVIVTGNGQRSKNSAVSNGYHRLKIGETYFIVAEQFFHQNNLRYREEGRLYEVSKNKNNNWGSQNVFAFDLQPVFTPQKTMANLYCDLPNI